MQLGPLREALLAVRYFSRGKYKTIVSGPGEGNGNLFMPEGKTIKTSVSLQGEVHPLFSQMCENTPVDNIRVT
jgi:hypothetical protein